MTGALARRWDGLVRQADLDAWGNNTFRERALPHMRGIDGRQSVSFLAAQAGDPCRARATTMWKDEAALRKFPGDSPALAVVPDFRAPFFVEYDAEATLHTEIFTETKQ